MTPVKTRVVEVAPAPEEGWWSLLQRSVEHTHILTPPSFLSTHRLCSSTWVVYSGGEVGHGCNRDKVKMDYLATMETF